MNLKQHPLKILLGVFLLACLVGFGVGLSGCTDTRRAQMERNWTDKPSDVTCLHYGQVLYQGKSKGRVQSDENGRLTFVDAANNRLTAVEGECVVVYAR